MEYHSRCSKKIYHICRNCPVGNNIEAENLKEGRPTNSRMCYVCKKKKKRNKCTRGIPIPAQ